MELSHFYFRIIGNVCQIDLACSLRLLGLIFSLIYNYVNNMQQWFCFS